VRAREIASLIGTLSATRPQHECASLYLAKLNRLKCQAVCLKGWNAVTQLTRAVLPELHWWLRALRANVPNDIRPFQPTCEIYSDASETGWGGWIILCNNQHHQKQLKTHTPEEERWLCGWWKDEAINCIRELKAIIILVKLCVQRGWLKENSDVLIHTDNTNCEYNLRRKRSGWRMRKMIKAFMLWLTKKKIRLDAEHIPGIDNAKADSLSRLAKSGDYCLRPGVMAAVEEKLGIQADFDLFATRTNKQKAAYCTTRLDKKGMKIRGIQVRNALRIPNWAALGVVLAHPPIRVIPRTLAKIRQDHSTAILIAPCWPGAVWTAPLRSMIVRGPVILGSCENTLQPGKTMLKKNYALPPGDLAAYLLQG
jgi:hypothetical protein